MTAAGEQRERRGAFFGRRKGKKLRPRQALLLDTLLPKLAIDLSAPAPTDPCGLFPEAVDGVRLEIGFGGGEYLIAEAERHPNTGFIGIEAFTNGMAKALAAIEARDLRNIRLHHGDATDLLAWLPRAGLARVDLIYPDPWPKRRHWKRRFIQPASIAELARVLKPGGDFRFVTDIADYSAWTLKRVINSPDFIWSAERAGDWKSPWPGFAGTRYEAKAKRVGRLPCYLSFQRR
jgi:tRNA (guanine-N7-)-methyltransferase